MIDTDKYERMLKDETYRLDGRNNMMALTLLAEVKRLQEENSKQLDVLSTLDEMIRFGNDHFEMMKALEQGLDITETWKEMKKNE